MKSKSSRRTFLSAAGLALPAAALASATHSTGDNSADPRKPPQVTDGGLRYRTLGRTGLKVTSMGFGCMITSDPSVIEKAADLGINYFDTARVYQGGNNERMVGAALKKKRNQITLSSKSGAEKKIEALANLDTSLKELGTDHLDVWYLHAKGKASQITDEWLEAQAQAKKEGKIRFSGVSCHGGHEEIIPAVIAKKDQIDVILLGYNFTMGEKIDGLIEQADKAGLGLVAMKVMAGGFKRAKPGDKLYDTLKRDGANLAALKWVLRNPNIDTTVPSITDMDQLDENIGAMTNPLKPGDERVLALQLDYIRPLYCRMCGQCEGVCPKGLPVADMLRFVMYAEGYGEYRLGRENFLALSDELKSVRCGDCDHCPIQCPNGVRVSERLSRAQELFA